MSTPPDFAPYQDIADTLLPVLADMLDMDDGSHDLSHILRVWQNVRLLMAEEGGDGVVLLAATLLHDCVAVPKDSPQRAAASRLSAQKAAGVLEGLGWSPERVGAVAHAVEAHSYSANIAPETLEAAILQDADRLDATGHIGIARCFYVSGRLNRALYDPHDPDAAARPLDDAAYAVDHFHAKLLRLSGTFRTDAGNRIGRRRHRVLRDFLDGLMEEVAQGDHAAPTKNP